MAETQALVQYGSYSGEAAEREEREVKQGDFMKLAVGKNVVRVLPPPMGKDSPFRVVWMHFVHRPGESEPVVFACPLKEARKPCPVCAKADQLKTSGDQNAYDRAKDLFPRRRVFANVIDRANPNAGPKILGFGATIHDALIKLRKNGDVGGDFTDPLHGFDVVIERTGTGKEDTRYTVNPLVVNRQFVVGPLGNMEWVNQQSDLEKLVKILSPSEILAKLSGEEKSQAGQAPRGQVQQQPRAATIVDAKMDGNDPNSFPY